MLLLAAAGGASSGPVDPGPTGPIPHTLPTPLNGVVAGIRPTGRLLATYTVGANGEDYTTPDAAMTAGKALQTATGKGTGIAWNANAGIDEIGPDFRVDMILAAGTWKGDLGTGAYIHMYGQGSAKTELWSDTIGSGGTVHEFGAMHMEGITLRSELGTDGTGPKYPMHITLARGTTVFADVQFLSHAALTVGGPTMAAGMDGGNAVYVLFYRCRFDSTAALNLHGGASNDRPLVVAFVECTGTAPLGYGDVGAGTADEIYIIDCTNPSATITGPNVKTYTKGFAGTVTAAMVIPTTTWPQPTGGLSPVDQAFFLPSIIGQAGQANALPGTTATMSPTAGRTYFIPVDITTAIHTTYVGITASAAGGSYQAVPMHGGAVPLVSWAQTSTPNAISSAGDKDWKYYYPRTFYPGETRAWVAARFTADAQILGSSTITTARDCYYTDDGSTLVKAPAGMVFPLAHVRAA